MMYQLLKLAYLKENFSNKISPNNLSYIEERDKKNTNNTNFTKAVQFHSKTFQERMQ